MLVEIDHNKQPRSKLWGIKPKEIKQDRIAD